MNYRSMDMSTGNQGSDASCKLSMLWNWYTIDACILSETWHVRSRGAFVGSVIGVCMLAVLTEGVRRAAREYDRRIPLLARVASQSKPYLKQDSVEALTVFCPTPFQQLIRGCFWGTQLALAYVLMLIAMTFNGYMFLSIIFGTIAGYAIFSRDTVGETLQTQDNGTCC